MLHGLFVATQEPPAAPVKRKVSQRDGDDPSQSKNRCRNSKVRKNLFPEARMHTRSQWVVSSTENSDFKVMGFR